MLCVIDIRAFLYLQIFANSDQILVKWNERITVNLIAGIRDKIIKRNVKQSRYDHGPGYEVECRLY